MACKVNSTWHLLRKQENNFKAVLECIRDLMNERTVLPEWLHDIFLGYGDPAAAQYTKLPNTLRTVDFKVSASLHASRSFAVYFPSDMHPRACLKQTCGYLCAFSFSGSHGIA